MYGSIFRMKVKRGQEQKVVDIFKEWDREHRPRVKGAVAGFVLKPEAKAGELLGVAVFQDKAAYVTNADSPEQDMWYRRLRDLLVADPEWEDGEFLVSMMAR